jgi:pullulanase/glycogen debranching enzyme
MRGLEFVRLGAWVLFSVLGLASCGGGGGGGVETPPAPPVQPPVADERLAWGNATPLATVLNAVPPPAPAASQPGGGGATSLRIHFKKNDGDYAGWTLHTWEAAEETTWAAGRTPAGTTSFGVYYDVPLRTPTGRVGYIFHKGDQKAHDPDQFHTLTAGRNEIWRIAGDATTYGSEPGASALPPDIRTVRVRYKRFANDFQAWGLHLWASSGLDTARVPSGVNIDRWGEPVRFNQMPGHAATTGEVTFEIPVRNPRTEAGAPRTLEFIVHGMPPNENDKDGRNDNIRVDYSALSVNGQVGEIWLVERDATVYTAAPDLRRVDLREARAFWLNRGLVKWPRNDGAGVVKLYHSRTGQLNAGLGGTVTGADGALTLELSTAPVPAAAAERFRWLGAGAVFAVKAADQASIPALLKSQLVIVQEDAAGKVQNATALQVPGALDDLYAAAANVNDLGVSIAAGQTRFKLWAPTAQRVFVFTYDTSGSAAATVDEMAMDGSTGVWSAARTGDLSGRYYRFAVETFVRGVGLVRNLVTDPYSIGLSANSARSYIADLNAAALKPAGWDASRVPDKVQAATDMSVYELHVRDFSAGDTTVTASNRGKYLAFTESGSNGMKHLKALADAGVTDVHLLPVFDIASVPETGCTTPAPAGGPATETQQATVAATAAGDCFNWGYDPWHFTAPEGSYASNADDGAARIVEFRRMVMGLHAAGLRVGMDVVYNHTTASGQNDKSVLDRVVPGYYHRLTDTGVVTNSTCCDNTATEHLMMAKLMVDSAVVWARDYKIASFRFDLMGHQPRAAMEELQRKVNAAAGRSVQLFGEGWNFGEVVDNARFVQAKQGGLGGSGIGTFGDKLRDAVRGGGCCDSGSALVSEQGFVNGLFYAPNASAGNRPLNDLRWRGDQIRGALAGSIRDFTILTHWDATLQLKDLNNVGYAQDPGEVVNYVENHDNLTLFDNHALKLPLATPMADRARVQILSAATVAFAQGVAYYHAGVDLLRSKSLDRNSYDSGDWFNRLDFGYADNNFGVGLPPQRENGSTWELMRPFLGNTALKAGRSDIEWTRAAFLDLMRIRASTTLLRLRSAADIRQRMSLPNTGSSQVATVLVGHVDGNGYAGAGFRELIYFINVDVAARDVPVPAHAGKAWELHPVHRAAGAADTRAATSSVNAQGTFTIPARTAVVFVVR